jgi:hypothetical protein
LIFTVLVLCGYVAVTGLLSTFIAINENILEIKEELKSLNSTQGLELDEVLSKILFDHLILVRIQERLRLRRVIHLHQLLLLVLDHTILVNATPALHFEVFRDNLPLDIEELEDLAGKAHQVDRSPFEDEAEDPLLRVLLKMAARLHPLQGQLGVRINRLS